MTDGDTPLRPRSAVAFKKDQAPFKKERTPFKKKKNLESRQGSLRKAARLLPDGADIIFRQAELSRDGR